MKIFYPNTVKTSFSSFRNFATAVLFGGAFAFGLSPAAASAQIIANFDAGNTSEEVDGNPGKAGSGWQSEWYTSSPVFPGTTMAAEVKGSDPLSGGSGPYLSIEMTNDVVSATASRTLAFGRRYEDYGVVSLSALHTVSFLYRVNTPSGVTAVAPGVFDSSTNNPGAPNSSSSFYLRVVGGNWYYYTSSTTSFNTGVPLIYGDTYEFAIQVDPVAKEWAFNIINLDNEELSFSIESLPFYGADFYGENSRDSVGGNLRWNMTLADRRSDDAPLRAVAYDIDSVLIIPEPGVSALLVGAGVLLLAGRWRAGRRH